MEEESDGAAPYTTQRTGTFGIWTSIILLTLFSFFMSALFYDHLNLILSNKTFIDYLAVQSNPFLVHTDSLAFFPFSQPCGFFAHFFLLLLIAGQDDNSVAHASQES